MLRMWKKKIGLFVLLAIISAIAVLGYIQSKGDSQSTFLKDSLDHYTRALNAFGKGDFDAAAGQLQVAETNAKYCDNDLASLLATAITEVNSGASPNMTASRIDARYNAYNHQYGWGYPDFDTSKPMAASPQESPRRASPGGGNQNPAEVPVSGMD